MSNKTRVTVSDAAAPNESTHVAQDSSKPEHAAGDTGQSNGNSDEKEFGGQAGPEPTRYGDWEKKGRVTDF